MNKEWIKVSKEEYLNFLNNWDQTKTPLTCYTATIVDPALRVLFVEDNKHFADCTWVVKIIMNWMGENGEIDLSDKFYEYKINKDFYGQSETPVIPLLAEEPPSEPQPYKRLEDISSTIITRRECEDIQNEVQE